MLMMKTAMNFLPIPLCGRYLALLLLSYAGSAAALTVTSQQPAAHADETAPAGESNSPFNTLPATSMESSLPELGSAASTPRYTEKQLATLAKTFGEQYSDSSNQSLGEQAGNLALTQAAKLVQKDAQNMLSPLGTANIGLTVSDGRFTGTNSQLFSPLDESGDRLTYSQVGVIDQPDLTLGNIGLGQRWAKGRWLFGYNAFLDRDFEQDQMRASVGAEAWTDYLHLSANYYHPLSGMVAVADSATEFRGMARGYDITTKGYLPFYRQLGASLSYEQYLGDNVDLLGDGARQSNPVAVSVGVNYTPVPLVTLTASHKEGESGENQDQVGLSLNYRLGVPLKQQLSPAYVAEAHSLRGSRFDAVERNSTPVLEFEQRKTLSVFLATPPWTLHPGETLPLKLQIRADYRITGLSWQGDTQALSLTPPADNDDPHGWSIIMPAWDTTPGATNSYRLSVTLQDEKQQRVTSNWITLTVAPPLTANAAPPTFPAF